VSASAPQNQIWMRAAIAEANKALAADEVPIGAIVVHEPAQKVIGRGHNRRETDHDPTAHAEIIALQQAARELKSWRLIDCALVVTLEPCPMCAGAIVNARVPRLVYGCADPKAGAVRTLYRLCEDDRLNHRVVVEEGVLADECAELLKNFFRRQRAMGKK
jgi:tRNA(adenine34) deaminase